ncbi:MAG: TSUP family transporter [Rhizobacter sp.]
MANYLTALASFDASTLALLGAIYAGSAVFSGLSGFGFSAIGALTLCLVPPQFGICMLMVLSLFTQAISLGTLRQEIRAHNTRWQNGFLPYAAGGILGLPFGLQILARAPTRGLVCGLGLLLVAYALYSSFRKPSLRPSREGTTFAGALAVGAVGGVVGGFSAFPGSALVVWNGLKNVPKEQGRALTQPFILVMQFAALSILVVARPTLFDARLLTLLAPALPLAWAGNRLGVEIYKRTNQVNYRLVTLAALGISGLSLLLKASLFA